MFVLHYKPRKISLVKNSDKKVSLVGKIVSVGKNSFILDDGSGRIEIFCEKTPEEKNLVRVFCSVIEDKLKSDVIQSLNGFDINLYNKVQELYKRAGI